LPCTIFAGISILDAESGSHEHPVVEQSLVLRGAQNFAVGYFCALSSQLALLFDFRWQCVLSTRFSAFSMLLFCRKITLL